MTEAAFGIPEWIPERSARMMRAEDAAAAREARRAELARDERREAAADKALGAYRTAAEARGEAVSALALATGEVAGRTLGDIFADARRAADREDARDALRQQREAAAEPVCWIEDAAVDRAASYHEDRLLRRAEDMHRDLVAYMARTNYAGALEATRAKSTYGRREAVRAENAPYAPGHVITRAYGTDFR